LAPAPDGNQFIQVNQDASTILLDSSFEQIGLLSLDSQPLEIRWLPDSSGFLYRTPLSLFLYQMETNTSILLISSNLFSDYRNLNAVWIEFEQ
jgi:hypothetical protein